MIWICEVLSCPPSPSEREFSVDDSEKSLGALVCLKFGKARRTSLRRLACWRRCARKRMRLFWLRGELHGWLSRVHVRKGSNFPLHEEEIASYRLVTSGIVTEGRAVLCNSLKLAADEQTTGARAAPRARVEDQSFGRRPREAHTPRLTPLCIARFIAAPAPGSDTTSWR